MPNLETEIWIRKHQMHGFRFQSKFAKSGARSRIAGCPDILKPGKLSLAPRKTQKPLDICGMRCKGERGIPDKQRQYLCLRFL